MPVLAAQVLALVGNILGGYLIKLVLNQAMIEWIIRWSARRLVNMTKTNHDNDFLDQIEKVLDEGAKPKEEANGQPK